MTATNSIGLLCPACKVDLVMTERKDVEIDYCPKCRGVWLDRGELDKIIEKSAAQEMQQQREPAQPQQQHGHDDYGKRGNMANAVSVAATAIAANHGCRKSSTEAIGDGRRSPMP